MSSGIRLVRMTIPTLSSMKRESWDDPRAFPGGCSCTLGSGGPEVPRTPALRRSTRTLARWNLLRHVTLEPLRDDRVDRVGAGACDHERDRRREEREREPDAAG